MNRDQLLTTKGHQTKYDLALGIVPGKSLIKDTRRQYQTPTLHKSPGLLESELCQLIILTTFLLFINGEIKFNGKWNLSEIIVFFSHEWK